MDSVSELELKNKITWLPTVSTTTTTTTLPSIEETINSILHALIYEQSYSIAIEIGTNSTATTATTNEQCTSEIGPIFEQVHEYNRRKLQYSLDTNKIEQQNMLASGEVGCKKHWSYGEGDKHGKREEMMTKKSDIETDIIETKQKKCGDNAIVVEKFNEINANKFNNFYANDAHHDQKQQMESYQEQTVRDVVDYYDEDVDEADADAYYDDDDNYWDEENASQRSQNGTTDEDDDESLYADEEDYDGDDEFSTNFATEDEDDESYDYDDDVIDEGINYVQTENRNEIETKTPNNKHETSDIVRFHSSNHELVDNRYYVNDYFNESDFEFGDESCSVFDFGPSVASDQVEYRNGMTIEEMARLMEQQASATNLLKSDKSSV